MCYTMLMNLYNEHYLNIDVYQCNYYFLKTSPLMLADGTSKVYKQSMPGVGTKSWEQNMQNLVKPSRIYLDNHFLVNISRISDCQCFSHFFTHYCILLHSFPTPVHFFIVCQTSNFYLLYKTKHLLIAIEIYLVGKLEKNYIP